MLRRKYTESDLDVIDSLLDGEWHTARWLAEETGRSRSTLDAVLTRIRKELEVRLGPGPRRWYRLTPRAAVLHQAHAAEDPRSP